MFGTLLFVKKNPSDFLKGKLNPHRGGYCPSSQSRNIEGLFELQEPSTSPRELLPELQRYKVKCVALVAEVTSYATARNNNHDIVFLL